MTARAAGAQVGVAPSTPARLSLADWRAAFGSAGKRFLADDCMGLAQQVAYSSLLAFFPAVVFLVGLLGLIDGYDDLREFLAPIAPGDVLKTVDRLQADSTGAAASLAFVIGATAAVWAASGAMGTVIKAVNRAYELVETRPGWKTRLTAIVLVALTGLVTAGLFLLIVFGGPLGTAIADAAGLGGAFELLWGIVRWPLAFVAVLLFFALVYYLAPNRTVRRWEWISPGAVAAAFAWLGAVGALRALHVALGLVLEDVRRARERDRPAALAQLLGRCAALRRRAELGARPPGRDPRLGWPERRADEAEPPPRALIRRLARPDGRGAPKRLRVRVAVPAQRARPELDGPRARARETRRSSSGSRPARRGGSCVPSSGRGRSRRPRPPSASGCAPRRGSSARSTSRARPCRRASSASAGGGGGGGGGGLPTVKAPNISPECGSHR